MTPTRSRLVTSWKLLDRYECCEPVTPCFPLKNYTNLFFFFLQEISEKELDKDREELLAALKKAREQTTKTSIENSSLRANQVRAKEQFNNHVRRLDTDVNFERDREQVKSHKIDT